MRQDRLPELLARLDAWSQNGAVQADPVRFRFLRAMAGRAAGQDGLARDLLEARLEALMSDYDHARSSRTSASPPDGATASAGPLAALNSVIAAAQSSGKRRHLGGAYPELGMLDEARQTWLQVGTRQQLRQSCDRVPDNAGPLNSSHLISRMLLRMQALSPGYLRQFLAYADALAWLERIEATSATPAETTRAATARKSSRQRGR